MNGERLTAVLDDLVGSGAVPGLAAAVTDRTGTIYEHVAGAADRARSADVAAGSRFPLASLTKPLVATAALAAVEEGVIELDAPLALHLPGVAEQVTLRRALSHSSGLPESAGLGIGEASSAADVLARAVAVPPVRGPEERRVYSNIGYDLVGGALAAATGLPISTYLEEAVLEPLGMVGTSLGARPDDPAIAWTQQPGLLAPGIAQFTSATFRRLALPSSGGFGTARDYASFLRFVLRGGLADTGGALLAPETFAELVTNQGGELAGGVESFMTWERADWGCGFEIRDAKDPHWTGSALTPSAVTHFGASGALCFADPERGVGACVLAGRSTYSGWMLRAEAWPAIAEAVVG